MAVRLCLNTLKRLAFAVSHRRRSLARPPARPAMLKRIDWLHLKGQRGGGSDSDSSGDDSDEDSAPEDRPGVVARARPSGRFTAEQDIDSGDVSDEAEEGEEDSLGDTEDGDSDEPPAKRLARSFDDISDPDEDEEDGHSDEGDVSADDITADHVVQ
jgi:hypothetical protein